MELVPRGRGGGGPARSLLHPRNLRAAWNTGQQIGRAARNLYEQATRETPDTTMENDAENIDDEGEGENMGPDSTMAQLGTGSIGTGYPKSNTGRGIADNTFWGWPWRGMKEQTFHFSIDGVSNILNKSLQQPDIFLLHPQILNNYVYVDALRQRRELLNYLIQVEEFGPWQFQMKMAEMKIHVLSVTRETNLISSGTQFKAREFINAPLLIGKLMERRVTNVPLATVTGETNNEIAQFVTTTTLNDAYNKNYPENEKSFHFIPYLPGSSWSCKHYSNANYWYDMRNIQRRISDTDGLLLNLPRYLPIETYETNTTNDMEAVNAAQPYAVGTGNTAEFHNYNLTKFPPIDSYALAAPQILGEDGNNMTFNYTLRVETSIIFEMKAPQVQSQVINSGRQIDSYRFKPIPDIDVTATPVQVLVKNTGRGIATNTTL